MPANGRRGAPQGTVPQKAVHAPEPGNRFRGATVKACGKSARIAAVTPLSANPTRSKVKSQVQPSQGGRRVVRPNLQVGRYRALATALAEEWSPLAPRRRSAGTEPGL